MFPFANASVPATLDTDMMMSQSHETFPVGVSRDNSCHVTADKQQKAGGTSRNLEKFWGVKEID